jgi:hypothetical protein
MSITLEELEDELNFLVCGSIAHLVFDWQGLMDKRVFERQLETGHAWGKLEIPEPIRRVQKAAKEQGEVFVWYSGFSGSWGGYTYSLQVVDGICSVTVQNLLTEDMLTFYDESTNDTSTNSRCLQLSISGFQLNHLRSWPNWVKSEALTSRYVYEFSETRILGAAEYAVQVKDNWNDSKTDLITDYEDSIDALFGL